MLISAAPVSIRDSLIDEYHRVRSVSRDICAPLENDDYQVQSIAQTSPPKWHLAHTSWFFETFVLGRFIPKYKPFNPKFDFIFNSYYVTHGEIHPRAARGQLSRPTVEQIYDYRAYIDDQITRLMQSASDKDWPDLAEFIVLGINHEQQHQELLLMDIKHNFHANPLKPAYRENLPRPRGEMRPMSWVLYGEGVYQIGHEGNAFAFDNEAPRHDVFLNGFRLADRLITNAEYLDFINDGGYEDPVLWLSDGWSLIAEQGWKHPLYWQPNDDGWQQFTLGGLRPLNPAEPVCHVSYYEAEAYSRWAGKRLPLESEIEVVLAKKPFKGTFYESGLLHPAPARHGGAQWYGDLWTWTSSPYTPYPGFKPLNGAIGEYNGKFMSNQMVLRGGSCVTASDHIRASYRNFFYPNERWAFTGIRLADDI